MTLSLLPPKWTNDWFPDEFALRSCIFNTWRDVCISFGYEEYLGPIVEYADIYRAKSWEDVGGAELTIITDRWWRELALRPEMTPTVTRMISSRYTQLPKPIRYFSIANFFRNERPQRWRNREFWQLNYDCFGSDSIWAVIEVIQLGIEIMKRYWAPIGSYVVHLNDRTMINEFLTNIVWLNDDQITEAIRTMDKWNKLSKEQFIATMWDKNISLDQSQQIIEFLENDIAVQKWTSSWRDSLMSLYNQLVALWYGEYIQISTSLMRWFDYYSWPVFEFFDTHPNNNRAMFGWWAYNGLANIFWVDSFPAVGAAPWDETTKLFIESRWLEEALLAKYQNVLRYYLPNLIESEDWQIIVQKLAHTIRQWMGLSVTTTFDVKKLGKSLEFANKQWFDYIIILWQNELEESCYIIKNLKSWEQTSHPLLT